MKNFISFLGLYLPITIYLFDAFGTQYVIQHKVRKTIRKERKGEFVPYSKWQTSSVERFVSTIIFWILGLFLSIYLFPKLGLLGLIIITYCYGALPWIYYYDIRKSWRNDYEIISNNLSDRRPDWVILIRNIFRPLVWFFYAMIFYVKDFIGTWK